MKKIINILLVVVLLISSLFIFSGCAESEKSNSEKGNQKQALKSAAGTYDGQYGKFVGDPDSAKVEDEEFYLELNADGTGVHHRDDYEFKVTWKLDGDKFSMSETFIGDPLEYTGTLKDGKLDIFNGDPEEDFTYEYVYEKK